jgi:hypothetical protein
MEESEAKNKKRCCRKKKNNEDDANTEAAGKLEEAKRTKKRETKTNETIQCKVGTFYIQF